MKKVFAPNGKSVEFNISADVSDFDGLKEIIEKNGGIVRHSCGEGCIQVFEGRIPASTSSLACTLDQIMSSIEVQAIRFDFGQSNARVQDDNLCTIGIDEIKPQNKTTGSRIPYSPAEDKQIFEFIFGHPQSSKYFCFQELSQLINRSFDSVKNRWNQLKKKPQCLEWKKRYDAQKRKRRGSFLRTDASATTGATASADAVPTAPLPSATPRSSSPSDPHTIQNEGLPSVVSPASNSSQQAEHTHLCTSRQRPSSPSAYMQYAEADQPLLATQAQHEPNTQIGVEEDMADLSSPIPLGPLPVGKPSSGARAPSPLPSALPSTQPPSKQDVFSATQSDEAPRNVVRSKRKREDGPSARTARGSQAAPRPKQAKEASAVTPSSAPGDMDCEVWYSAPASPPSRAHLEMANAVQQLAIRTQHPVVVVVYALYMCSGSFPAAESFLRGEPVHHWTAASCRKLVQSPLNLTEESDFAQVQRVILRLSEELGLPFGTILERVCWMNAVPKHEVEQKLEALDKEG
eukprot:GCRY01001938.1.p1 GENE.GCRY01001938.1~~GCRY01001938.1.p1  ORF type:complete len:518 (-),score=82.29 GCRY01001938.1:332-1885(-)